MMINLSKKINQNIYFHKENKNFVILFLFTCFIYLFIRNNSAIYLGVLDEYYYNLYARLLPFSEAQYGNFLYYLIYRATNYCGDGFLSCVYLFNIIFYLGAFFPIYAVTKDYCSPIQGFWLSCLAVLAPINNMTAYFMPESLYFLIFWILIWVLLKDSLIDSRNKNILYGLVVAILSLVKVHGLFLVPAIIIFIMYQSLKYDQYSFKNIVINVSLFIITIIITRFFFGILIAGSSGITLFGSYGGVIGHAVDLVNEINDNAKNSLSISKISSIEILRREATDLVLLNILPIVLIYAPALAVIIIGLFATRNQIKQYEKFQFQIGNLSVLSIAVVVSLISIITIAHLVMVARGIGSFQLFWRYYEFTFPLIILLSVAFINHQEIDNKFSKKIVSIISIALVIVCIYTLSIKAGNHWIRPDSNKIAYYGIGVLIVVCLLIAIFSLKKSIFLYIWVVFPLIVITSNIAIYQELKVNRITPNESAISKFINSHLDRNQLDKLVVLMNNQIDDLDLPKFLMNINHAPIQVIKIPNSEREVSTDLMPNNKDWILLIGNHALTGSKLFETHQDLLIFGGMTLFGGHGRFDIDFTEANWPGIIKKQSGLFNPPETWGAWSIEKDVIFEFYKPLPRKFNLILDARAFGPNQYSEFELIIGNEKTSFKINSYPEFSKIKILVNNFSKLSSFSIVVPNPISPMELNQGTDNRKLGIGLKTITIEW